jgi:ribosomal protein L7/L12
MTNAADQLPPEVLEALRQGRTVDAIKLLRGTTLGLKDAMQILDAYKRGSLGQVVTRVTMGSLPAEVKDALEKGNKIEAIKRMREARGVGLKQAKDAVEAAHRPVKASPADLKGYSPGEVPRSENFAWVIAVAAAAFLAGIYLYIFHG